MKYKRFYIFPICVLAVIFLLRIVFLIYVFSLSKNLESDPADVYRFRKNFINFEAFFWPFLCLVEITVYSVIRKKIYNRNWVLIHSWAILFAFVILPVLYVIASFFYRDQLRTGAVSLQYFLSVRVIIFWLLVALGHLFFILIIIKSFNKQDVIPSETPGLLDEFIS